MATRGRRKSRDLDECSLERQREAVWKEHIVQRQKQGRLGEGGDLRHEGVVFKKMDWEDVLSTSCSA